ncbi:MAG: hypothetical protein HOE48_00065 [Candidatus Latescibacteria bacterium]|nr:hypothetical protein [Candidatus Latescibacterota bacterium]MBT4136271.1 hypothetical protein [Candidatus Latescibacterota bacterium]MBT5829378.1 hypothetical protein [Candidatus Latescibacterota bacterium]
MKKTFNLTHPKIKTDRLIEAVKADVNKYLKRERRRELPEGVDFWDFTCKFGPTAKEAKGVHVAEVGKCIDAVKEETWESCYVEILAKPGRRKKKPQQTNTESNAQPASEYTPR